MTPRPPIDTIDLFPGERQALLDLLADLAGAEWHHSTACPGWSVHDIALHLLGGDIGVLSRGRDDFNGPPTAATADLADWPTLVANIDGRNDDWLRATRRISPRLLRELLGFTGDGLVAYLRTLDLDAVGGPVSWAGPGPEPVWLDVAREYTERWVHQQQIRDAVGRPGLTEPRWLAPVLDTFARALPHTLRDVDAPLGTGVQLIIAAGDAGGTWSAVMSETGWGLDAHPAPVPAATVTIDQDLAWRLFTKGVTEDEAARRVGKTGDAAIADQVRRMVSIIAQRRHDQPNEMAVNPRVDLGAGGDQMPEFIPGLQLSEMFYQEAVRPILDRAFARLRHSAALVGYGSDVLGFDTDRSTDHEWGPRVLLFLAEPELDAYRPAIVETLRQALPPEVRGYPTGFGSADEEGIRRLEWTDTGPVEHKVEVTSLPRFLHDRLGIESYSSIDILDWLVCSEQRLREVTAGAVFHDGLGELVPARAALAYYPRDVWRYLLAAQWKRISQQEAFVGRCAEAGDEIGSALIAAGLVRDVMRLAFLMERTYAPYSKWFGSAFARLRCAERLRPHLDGALAARTVRERERHLGRAFEMVAAMHNDLGITEPLPTEVSPFYGRPYLVIHGERFARAIRARIADERVLGLPLDIGSIDQFVDSTDVLTGTPLRARLKAIYAES